MEEINKLKITRRNRKGVLTRTLNELSELLKGELDNRVIQETLDKANSLYEKVEEAHSELVRQIEKDDEFEVEEQWMLDCQKAFMVVKNETKKKLNEHTRPNIPSVNIGLTSEPTQETESGVAQAEQSQSHSDESESLPEQENRPEDEQCKVETGEKLSSLFEVFSLSRPSTRLFSGDPLYFHSFVTSFTNMTCAVSNDSVRLDMLMSRCEGEALEAIQFCNMKAPEEGFKMAMKTLTERYGDSATVAQAWIKKVTNRPKVDAGNIQKFADDLENCYEALVTLGYLSELNNQASLKQILLKVPRFLQNRWAGENYKIKKETGKNAELKDVVQFIRKAAAEITDPVFGSNRNGDEASGVSNRTSNRKDFAGNKAFHVNQGQTERGVRPKSVNLCVGCNERTNHRLWECDSFRKLSIESRWDLVTKCRLCFKCLGRHFARDCTRKMHCGINECTGDHNRLLHKNKVQVEQNSPMGGECPSEADIHENSMRSYLSQKGGRSLRTVPVKVQNGAKCVIVNALLDDGSDQTYVTNSLAAELGLKGEPSEAIANLFHGKEERFQTSSVQFEVSGLEQSTSKRYKLKALTVDDVCGKLKPHNWSLLSKDWEHLKDIEFPYPGKRVVDMLIGVDYPELHIAVEERIGKKGEPIARKTPLGWTCIGPISKTNRVSVYHVKQVNTFKCCSTELGSVGQCLEKFWEIERVCDVTKMPIHTEEEINAMKVVEQSMKKCEGRYEVKIPWKKSKMEMPHGNKQVAENRLKNLEKKLERDDWLRQAYVDVMNKYQEKGYISKVDPTTSVEQEWFLPHFPVVRKDRETTKVRVVYDASSKCEGVSLNDVIYNGPKLQNNLFDVLMGFRKKPIALICDISEMYLQIQLAKEDRAMFRFMWRDPVNMGEPEIYEFNRVVFGLNVAPFISQIVTQENARKHKDKYPAAAEAVLKSTYMDDTMESVDSVQMAVNLYHELRELWGQAGMEAKKWLSNSKEVMEQIPQELRVKEVSLTENELPSVSTLGLSWVAEQDHFRFKTSAVREVYKKELTKRQVLSKISTVFDPLGFVSPFVIQGKILMQEIWVSGIGWDEEVGGELQDRVCDWIRDIENLGDIRVNRCLCLEGAEDVELHTFVDGSSLAYGAVTYLRSVSNGQVDVQFVASKTKVAPIKVVSIPRLELMAAMVGLRLTQCITQSLQYELKKVVFWSDSTNTLWWIRGRSRTFKSFVANRVGEIQYHTNPSQWRYVPTKQNPADLASRGVSAKSLKESELWWFGPKFLKCAPQAWPENKVSPDSKDRQVEEKRQVIVCMYSARALLSPFTEGWRLDPKRYSKWTKLVRVTAYVLRFVNNCVLRKGDRVKGILNSDEMMQAENYQIRRAQVESFEEDIKRLYKGNAVRSNSVLSTMFPKIDEDGLLRMTGRLSLIEVLPYNVRYPIILPRGHAVTRLVVKQYHEKGNHAMGTNHLLSVISEKFWIIHGREEVREYERNCVVCKRNSVKPATQLMAPLPKHRVSVSLRAFCKVAVDYAGPFYTVQGRGKVRAKRYLCLFTCLATRAVHLELSYGLDTDTFLNALCRFTNRRGVPEEIVSDNGSNFIGADSELKEVWKLLDKQKIEEVASSKRIKWSFLPPVTPHFGGVHESLIKCAKRAIYAVLKNADVSDEELHSAFVGAEGILNSRPLTYMCASGKDPTPLTPSHFLHGSLGGNFSPEEVLDTTGFNPKRRWRRVQEILKHFWSRWVKEWLPQLNRRSKWKEEKRDLAQDDIVLVVEKDIPRGRWPLGRVVQVFPGKDGRVRVVKVKTAKGEVTRGITRVCPLEVM